MTTPYLASEDLAPRMAERPDRAFLVRPDIYSVIDGDTLKIRTAPDQEGVRHEAFRIRLSSIDTPELRRTSLFDQVLRAGGHDPLRDGPGEVARDFLRKMCRSRVVLVDPAINDEGQIATDKYGRLLAQVCVSGAPGDLFEISGARSIEHALFDAGLAWIMPGKDLPPSRPPVLDRISQAMHEEHAFPGMSP